MRLSSLIASNKEITLEGSDVDISGITEDSRQVKPGFLFIAIPGNEKDGRAFIDDAVKRGARALLVPNITQLDSTIPTLRAHDVRSATSYCAARFYPDQPSLVVAVTGTSGKTSTAQFTRELWSNCDHASASIGTLGYVTSNETLYGSLTTPDALNLHRLLNESAHQGITHLVMEASSHGLELARLDNVRLKAGGFTNFSRDHLDYHQSMENYLAAKLRLFNKLLPRNSAAVLNADIPEFSIISEAAKCHGLNIISYGKQGQDLRLMRSTPVPDGQILQLEVFGKKHEVHLPVMGAFQVWNSLCALGLVIGSGDDVNNALKGLSNLSGVPGRLEWVGNTSQGASVFVDYAHKPDALENVLRALRPHVASHAGAKLGVVFGCGGNRDKGKRPLMGEIAQRLADWVIVTDDNPRHEDPTAIRQEILAGSHPTEALKEVANRGQAIQEGIAQLKQNDVLVIAGKGHEIGQIIGDQTLPFDDREVARKVLGL